MLRDFLTLDALISGHDHVFQLIFPVLVLLSVFAPTFFVLHFDAATVDASNFKATSGL